MIKSTDLQDQKPQQPQEAKKPKDPLFTNFYKYLDEDGKKALLRLEAIADLAEKSLLPQEPGDVRPLAHLANLYLEYVALADSTNMTEALSLNIYIMHLYLSKMEVMVVS